MYVVLLLTDLLLFSGQMEMFITGSWLYLLLWSLTLKTAGLTLALQSGIKMLMLDRKYS